MIAYHGTNQNFDRFDADSLGISTASESSRMAFFFSLSRETAEVYAHSAARKLIPNQAAHEAQVANLLARSRAAERLGDWDTALNLEREAEDMDLGAIRAGPRGACVVEVSLALVNPLEVQANGRMIFEIADTLRAAQAAGHDGVILRGIDDLPTGSGGVDDHVAVFSADAITIVARHELEPEPETGDLPSP